MDARASLGPISSVFVSERPPDLREAEEEAGHGALFHVERQQRVGHVDEEHGAPHAGVGGPRIRVKNNQHLGTGYQHNNNYISTFTHCRRILASLQNTNNQYK